MTVAIYPGTFDPVHYGHVDIAQRAAHLFDKVVVGVYDHPRKNVLFPVSIRVDMARDALQSIANIQVEAYGSLTVDFARAHQATAIVRGLRVISDFELEYQMALMNRQLSTEVDVVCLMTSLEYAFISSSIVKEIAQAGGCVAQFVPPAVDAALRSRLASEH